MKNCDIGVVRGCVGLPKSGNPTYAAREATRRATSGVATRQVNRALLRVDDRLHRVYRCPRDGRLLHQERPDGGARRGNVDRHLQRDAAARRYESGPVCPGLDRSRDVGRAAVVPDGDPARAAGTLDREGSRHEAVVLDTHVEGAGLAARDRDRPRFADGRRAVDAIAGERARARQADPGVREPERVGGHRTRHDVTSCTGEIAARRMHFTSEVGERDHVGVQGAVARTIGPDRAPRASVEVRDVVRRRDPVGVLERPRGEEKRLGRRQRVDEGQRGEPAVGSGRVRADRAPLGAVPLHDVVCGRDARNVNGIRADIHICPVGGESAHDPFDGPETGPRPHAHRVPRPVIGRHVVGLEDRVKVDEVSARVQDPVAVGRQGVNRAGEVAIVEDCRTGRARGQVAGEKVVGGGDLAAILECAADVERVADDLQGIDGSAKCSAGCRRGTERSPRAVPDREEVGVGVATGVEERAAYVDLAGVVGDRVD